MHIETAEHQQHLVTRYLNAFKPHGIVPILMPCDPHPGDTVAGLEPTVVARCADCFDQPIRWRAPATLPHLILPAGAALRFALRLGEAVVDSDLGRMPSALRFDQASVETVSRTALRQSLRSGAHPALAPLFANHPVKLDGDIMLLGQVFLARCTLRLERPSQGSLLARLRALAAHAGLRLRPATGGALQHADSLELSATSIRPVAWRPALIDAGPLTPDTFRTINQMRPRQATRNFDPASEADLHVLSAWIDRQLARLALQ